MKRAGLKAVLLVSLVWIVTPLAQARAAGQVLLIEPANGAAVANESLPVGYMTFKIGAETGQKCTDYFLELNGRDVAPFTANCATAYRLSAGDPAGTYTWRVWRFCGASYMTDSRCGGDLGRRIYSDSASFVVAPAVPPQVPAAPPSDTPPTAADLTAPQAKALPTIGWWGRLVNLRYRAADNSGATREEVRVYRGTTLVKTIRSRLDVIDQTATYTLPWLAPRLPLAGRWAFCVRATDAAGNTSAWSCAVLMMRR